MKQLVLGGARSGKSHYAEDLASKSGLDVIYIATAQAFDEEMQKRIEHHKSHRPSHWQVVEEPLQLANVIQQYAHTNTFILVDCLTLWLNNMLYSKIENLNDMMDELVNLIPTLEGNIAFVSNEVSMGIIPLGETTRRYVDEAGRMHQRLAAACDSVTLMVAGIPSKIK